MKDAHFKSMIGTKQKHQYKQSFYPVFWEVRIVADETLILKVESSSDSEDDLCDAFQGMMGSTFCGAQESDGDDDDNADGVANDEMS